MQLIPCPFCGPRAEIEFVYGCVADAAAGPANLSDHEELDRIFIRQNPRGAEVELWQHASGCRSWIKIARNTLTHEILRSEPARREKS
jgi:sarcosine oxidase, subunit delta